MDEEQRQTQKKKSPYWALASAVLTSLGIFYRFILRGYVYWGYLCFFIVFLILAHRFLPAILWKIILVLTCIGFVYFWIVEIPIIRSARTDPDPERPYLVVLGAAVYGDQPSLTLVRRLEGALEYLNEHPDTVYIAGCLGRSGQNGSCIKLMCSTDGGRSWYPSQVMTSDREFDRVNDLQQYGDRLLIYSESDVYSVSKAELIAQSTTAIRSVVSDTKESPAYDLQGRKVVNPKHGIYIINKRKVVK